jgi:ABC-2 type transport system permease protein
MSASLRQVLALSRRSVVNTIRQPQYVIPSLFFPLFFAALNVASFNKSTRLPGFPPVSSFLDFMLAATVVQGVLFGATGGGNDMAVDIQDGFFDRLVASPVPRWTILVGRLGGAAALGAVQASLFTGIMVVFGATIRGGIPGFLGILLVSVVLAVAIGGFAVALALRTGSAEAVQASFPIFFISLFMSSAFFPRQLMHGWFKAAATLNPISWMVEGLRNLVIRGFDIGQLGRALAVAGAMGVVSITLASLALRSRVRAA